MAASPYVSERQSEHWTSAELERFFRDLDFNVVSYPIQQLTERYWPSDYLFYDGITRKIFGFQYKALYHNGVDHWPIAEAQHHTLQRFPWMYYCLSELRDPKDRAAALHLARIVPSTFDHEAKIPAAFSPAAPRYMRWGAFYRGLVDCRHGRRVDTAADLYRALGIEPEGSLPRDLVGFAQVVLLELEVKKAQFFTHVHGNEYKA